MYFALLSSLKAAGVTLTQVMLSLLPTRNSLALSLRKVNAFKRFISTPVFVLVGTVFTATSTT